MIRPDELPGPSGPEQDPFFGGALEQQIRAFAGDDLLSESPGEGLYPDGEEEHQKQLTWCLNAFQAAEKAREQYDEKWKKYYKLYRSHLDDPKKSWNSKLFVPISFWIIETITPRLVAQLPKFTTVPVGPDDVEPAKKMETLLEWAANQSELYVELVKAYKSALKYGTGIIKTYHRVDKRRARKMQTPQIPLMATVDEPIIDPDTGEQMLDMTGQPMFESREVEAGTMPGESQMMRYTYTSYDGPAAECIDIFNFWVAPEAHDIDSARYVVHRTYKELSYVKKRIEEGIYTLPDFIELEKVGDTADDPALERLDEIGLGNGPGTDSTRNAVELLEFWTDDGRVITMANRKAIIRVQENPFDHSEKPFVRLVNYLQEHEFWGVGEIEPIEGLQDKQNALENSRIDNIRLVLNAMFAVNVSNIEDIADLTPRPGGVIRLKGDYKPQETIQRIDFGDITASVYQEAAANLETIEKTSGVSNYQMGLDSPSLNQTATGVSIIQEAGASRFGLKSKLIELMALRRLGRHYGTILQQFTTEERLIRLAGTTMDPMTGQAMPSWGTFDPESIQGALDYDIQSESSSQTQTMRVEQKNNTLNILAQYSQMVDPMTGMPVVPASTIRWAIKEVLEAQGIKDADQQLGGQPQPMPQMGMPGQGALPPSGLEPGVPYPPPGTHMMPDGSVMEGYASDMNPNNVPIQPDPLAVLGGATQGTGGQQKAANLQAMIEEAMNMRGNI